MRLVPLEMLYSHSDSTLATLVYTKPKAFDFIADTRRPALLPAAPRRPSKGVGAELPKALHIFTAHDVRRSASDSPCPATKRRWA